MANTFWNRMVVTPKLFLQSGQFTSTIKDSENVSAIDIYPSDISADRLNTPWVGAEAKKLYLQSGQLTSTLKTSQDISSIDTVPDGISYDSVNTPWCGATDDKLYLQSGQFTSTLKTSLSIGAVESTIYGISFDGTNTPWCGKGDDKLYLQSGQFTSTLKTSQDIGSVDTDCSGVSFNGTDTPWCGNGDNKLYLQSGQFTSTLKTSQSMVSSPTGIEHGGFGIRIGESDISLSSTTSTICNITGDLTGGLTDDTFWCGWNDKKLYIQSGQFSSTLKTSQDISSIDLTVHDISFDGVNSPWCGLTDDKLYLQSGRITSTLKTSQSVGSIDSAPTGISCDETNTPWCGASDNKLYLQSGQFTSTLKTSLDVTSIETTPTGITYDSVNTPWTGYDSKKLFLQSGQFTSTLKTSQNVSSIDVFPNGISFDGINTSWIGDGDNKLYLQSGQFTSTLKTSQDVGSIEDFPNGIEYENIYLRLGLIAESIVLESTTNIISSVSGLISREVELDSTSTIITSNVSSELLLGLETSLSSTINIVLDISGTLIREGIENLIGQSTISSNVISDLHGGMQACYWTIIAKNDTTSDVLIEDLGVIVPSKSSINLCHEIAYDEICGSIDLKVLILSNTLTINDGDNDLSIFDGVKIVTIQNIKDLEEKYYTKLNLQTFEESLIHWGNISKPSITITSDIILDSSYHSILVDASSDITIYLAPAAQMLSFKIKRIDNFGTTVTVDGNGSNIDGSSTKTISSQYEVLRIESDGTKYWVF